MKCVICGKEVSELIPYKDESASSCWGGGVVEWLVAGYGSIHDGARFLICICDNCLTTKLDASVSSRDMIPVSCTIESIIPRAQAWEQLQALRELNDGTTQRLKDAYDEGFRNGYEAGLNQGQLGPTTLCNI